jgi:hypothetical protein
MVHRSFKLLGGLACLLAGTLGIPSAASADFSPYIVYPTGSHPQSTAIGDVNSDGRNDVLLTTSSNGYNRTDPANDFKLFVFTQTASGGLASYKLPTSSASTGHSAQMGGAVGDVDGDGRNDAAVATIMGVDLYLQSAEGVLSYVGLIQNSPTYARQVLIADLDLDRVNEIVVNSGYGVTIMKKREGELAFDLVPVTSADLDEIEIGDLNSDGLPDIVGREAFTVRIYQQRTDGGYDARSVGLLADATYAPTGLGVGDLTNDHRDDVVFGRGGNRPWSGIGLLPQLPSGELASQPTVYPTYDLPEPVDVLDMNDDRLADVAVVHGGWRQVGLYLQNESGGLGPEQLFPIPYASHYDRKGLDLGDVNSDGYPDIAIGDYNFGLVVLTQVPPYPAPAVAARLSFSLVPNFRQTVSRSQCQARGGALSAHAPPLAVDSCSPPSALPAAVAHLGNRSTGLAEIRAVPGDSATPGTVADATFGVRLTDLRSGDNLGPDYDPNESGGDVSMIARWQITDRYNGQSMTDPATVTDFHFPVGVDCVPTADPTIGSTCEIDTTANTLVPGAIQAGRRMVIQVFRVRLNDAGANGTLGDADDRAFAMQGIFAP